MNRKKQKDERGTWVAIQESLDDFQPAPLAARLREDLVPRISRDATRLDEQTRRGLFEDVSALLARHAGDWYTKADVQLGNQVLGSYGWRDSFFPDGDGSHDLGVESNIQRILSALGVAHEWLCTLDTYFRSLSLPLDEEDRRAVLSDAVRRVIELTAEATGCAENWEHHARLALGWLLESQGIRRTGRVEQAVREALVDVMSGSAPSSDEARQVADTIARVAVREDGSRSYPDSGT